MRNKLCPLKKATIKTDIDTIKEYFTDCIEDACAWYVKETDECALKCLASRLENIITITEGVNYEE
jgi:hypothetical protein